MVGYAPAAGVRTTSFYASANADLRRGHGDAWSADLGSPRALLMAQGSIAQTDAQIPQRS